MDYILADSEVLYVEFEFLQKHRGVPDPLEVVAAEISDEAILLCLDEFMVLPFVLIIVARHYRQYNMLHYYICIDVFFMFLNR